MLSFTAAGAVSTPTTVQIRVTRQFSGRMEAGAPVPSRSLSATELRENLHYFAVDLRGPRTRPCTALVLSGDGLMERVELLSTLELARKWGIARVTLHVGPRELSRAVALPVDAVATRVVTPEQVAWGGLGRELQLTVVVPLVTAVLSSPEGLAHALVDAGPSRVVLTWPFPAGGDDLPPMAAEAARAVHTMLPLLDAGGIPVGVKGLPACALGSAERLWRSQNRWYVDATHQREQALLFFPDVVRFTKTDTCRHCGASHACDGAPEAWVHRGLTGPFEPLSE